MDMMSLTIGICALGTGLPQLLWPRKQREAAEIRSSARKSELDAGAEESFFEERRTLDAYPPKKTDRAWRIRGIFATICGTSLIILAFIRHPV